jgi:hypothetical protein
MRIYIIGNDGITLCGEPPAAVNEGEIVFASNEELHAAQLSGKRLQRRVKSEPDFLSLASGRLRPQYVES